MAKNWVGHYDPEETEIELFFAEKRMIKLSKAIQEDAKASAKEKDFTDY